jgi:hypothetical protein
MYNNANKEFYSELEKILKTARLNYLNCNYHVMGLEPISGSSPIDETLTEEQIQAKITEFKTKHPKFAAVVEGISNLDLKETVKAYLGAEVLQKLFKYHAKNLVEEKAAPTQ